MWGISSLAESLLASQEGLCSKVFENMGAEENIWP